jgi:hypothetical protein
MFQWQSLPGSVRKKRVWGRIVGDHKRKRLGFLEMLSSIGWHKY